MPLKYYTNSNHMIKIILNIIKTGLGYVLQAVNLLDDFEGYS